MMQVFKGTTSTWNTIISGLPHPHLLQTWEWSQVKAKYGWEPTYIVWSTAFYKSYTSDQLDQLDYSDLTNAIDSRIRQQLRICILKRSG